MMQWGLNFMTCCVIRTVYIKIDTSSGTVVFAHGVDGAGGAVTANVLGHRLRRHSPRGLTLNKKMIT